MGPIRNVVIRLSAAAATFLLAAACLAGQTVKVAPDLTLYYEQAGSGPPIVFIPGWTFTTDSLSHQVAHFSKRYRAIAYDPRGQGRSSKPPEGHHYAQHGQDLKAFLDALNLRGVVLVGHSWGCHTAYAYFRAHGISNVKAFVCIDSTPKLVVEGEGDWGMVKVPGDMRYFHDGYLFDRTKTAREFVQSLVTRPMAETDLRRFETELGKTPTSVAIQLDYDGTLADYAPEVRAIDGKIPVLHVLADPGWFPGWTQAGRDWLARNAPHSEVDAFGQHLVHWEFPERFNARIDAFLDKHR